VCRCVGGGLIHVGFAEARKYACLGNAVLGGCLFSWEWMGSRHVLMLVKFRFVLTCHQFYLFLMFYFVLSPQLGHGNKEDVDVPKRVEHLVKLGEVRFFFFFSVCFFCRMQYF
jgi:hypothetical protein